MKKTASFPKQTSLSAAVTSVFATVAMLLCAPCAAQTIINTPTGPQTWNTNDFEVTSTGSVVNPDPADGSGLEGTGSALGTLTNSGTISGFVAALDVKLGASVASIVNTRTGVMMSSMYFGAIWNQGNIDLISNDGLVDGETGISSDSQARIGVISNTVNGTIRASSSGVFNQGAIERIENSGTIDGQSRGIENGGAIQTLTNNGVIKGRLYGLDNDGNIQELNNGGNITGTWGGISLQGTIASMVNTKLISATGDNSSAGLAISYGGTIESLVNSGTISGISDATDQSVGSGIDMSLGTIVSLTNSGIISGAGGGANSFGDGIWLLNSSIGTLINSGTITGTRYALDFAPHWDVGVITNSGTIAGDIRTMGGSGSGLRIGGGTAAVFGTLTGLGGAVGTMTSDQNVQFTTGNLLLNDHIDVGGGVVSNAASTLQINNTIHVTGNYTQAAGATLQIGVSDASTAQGSTANDSGYGRLVVTGGAVLSPGSAVRLQRLNAYAFAPGQRFVVIDAALAGTQYNENALQYAANGSSLKVTGASVPLNGHNYLVLSIDQNAPVDPSDPPVTPPVTPPITPPVVPGITNYTGITDPGLLNLFNATKALGPDELKRAGAQLGPLMQVTASRAAAAPTMDALNIISTHTNGLRDRPDPLSTCDSEPLRGFWGQALGGHSSQADVGMIDGYRANFGGMLIGFDCAANERWRTGGVLSYSTTDITNTGYTAGSKIRVDGFGVIGYGSYAAERWYANLSGGVVKHRYNTTRNMDFPGFSGTARAGFGGTQLVARAEFGYPLATGAMAVTPVFALTYGYLNQNSYTEDDGNGAALSVGSTHTTSVTTDLAVKFSRQFDTSQGVLIPELQIGWRHQYDNAQGMTSSRFAADPVGETAFTTLGPSPTTNSALVTVGASLLRSDNLSLTLRYDLQAAAGFLSQAGSLRLRKSF